MVVHRLAKKKYAHDPLGGAGALLVGGRWHPKGVRIVYCAQTLSLASLEFFVHFEGLYKAIELVAIEIELPDSLVGDLPAASLPSNWDQTPPAAATADIGSEWLQNCRSAALRVPSVLTRGEFNVLINPAHADFKVVRVASLADYKYDTRMWKA
jgi:RES domain-containing protein